MAYKKGQSGNLNGRPVGTPNKITADIRDMVRTALDEAGGVKYLLRQASINPVAFMSLVAKIIPSDVHAHLKGEVNVTIKQFSPVLTESEKYIENMQQLRLDS